MDKKQLFEFGKVYLLRRQEIDEEVLEHYLTLWKIRRPKTMNELCRNMIDHAQNRQGMPNSIGDTENLRKILFDFEPDKIKLNFENWTELFNKINSTYTPPGRMEINNQHNYWVVFCKSIISISDYLSRFGSFDNYEKYVGTFISDNPDIRLAFPLILKEEIFGYKFALACDFTKENVSPKFIKPDTHIKDIFVGVGLCSKNDNDFNVFRKVINYCTEISEEPYSVDRLFWLIGSGKLFKAPSRLHEVMFQTNKFEFIEEFNRL